MDSKSIILEYWKDQRAQARHTEDQRAIFTNIVLIVTAALLGLVANIGFHESSLPLTVTIIFLGLFGAATSAKYYERYNVHLEQAIRFSEILSGKDTEHDHEKLLGPVRVDHAARYRIARLRLNKLWVAFHLVIAGIGFAMTVIVIVVMPR
jgi:hypothetical protein